MAITAAYCRQYKLLIPRDITTLLSISASALIVGEPNAKHPTWDQTTRNRNDTILYKTLVDLPYCVEHTDEPTFPRGGSTLDIVVNNNINIAKLTTVNDMESDHRPIQFDICSPNMVITDELLFNYEKSDWKKYRRYINDNLVLPTIDSSMAIDRALSPLNNFIQLATAHSTPLRDCGQPHVKPTPAIRVQLPSD